jgi:hypothetical protein
MELRLQELAIYATDLGRGWCCGKFRAGDTARSLLIHPCFPDLPMLRGLAVLVYHYHPMCDVVLCRWCVCICSPASFSLPAGQLLEQDLSTQSHKQQSIKKTSLPLALDHGSLHFSPLLCSRTSLAHVSFPEHPLRQLLTDM